MFLQFLLMLLFLFVFLDGFNQHTLVFVLVTFAGKIESVVLMLIDLSLTTIFFKKSTKGSLSSHPENSSWHSGFSSTSSFTTSTVTTLSDSLFVKSGSGPGVDSEGLTNDEVVSN